MAHRQAALRCERSKPAQAVLAAPPSLPEAATPWFVPLHSYEAERLSDGQRYALKVTELNALSQLDKVAVRNMLS